MTKGKVWTNCLFLLLFFIASSALAYDATEDDLYNAVNELIGKGAYSYFDHEGVDGVDGFRTKNWGTNGNLADSSKDHWTEELEFEENLSGLMSSTYYDMYAISGGKVNTGVNEAWGIRVGLESGNYILATVDIGDDNSIVKYNLGNYLNDSGIYPYREVQSDINAACMYAAFVGEVMTDGSGNLTVYVDDGEFVLDGVEGKRTWYDGLLLVPTENPHTPTPADGLVDMETSTDLELSWIAGKDPNGFDYMDSYVYFGTSKDSLELMNTEPIHTTSISVGATEYNTTYYWQVEQVEQDTVVVEGRDAGDPNNVFGPVWTFETTYYVPRITEIVRSDDDSRIGETVDLTVTYTTHSSYPVTDVVWYQDGVIIDADSDASFLQTTGETESVLSVLISEATFGTYYCVVNNGYGSSSPSEEVVFEPVTVWTWTGGAGTALWSGDLNWDQGVAPDRTNDIVINSGTVDIDLDGDFHYSSYYTLNGDAQLVCPAGKRFGSGEHDTSITTINDSSQLILNTTSYYVLSRNYPAEVNQNGGEVDVTLNGGFLFSDNNQSSGIYNLNSGLLNVTFDVTSGSASYYYQFMGKCPNSQDELNVNGGTASFDNAGGSERPVYIHRDSKIEVNSGSLLFTDFDRVSLGKSYDGTAVIELNGGELDMINTPLVIGDDASGELYVNGGLLNLEITDAQEAALTLAPATGCQAAVSQTAGSVIVNADISVGSSASTDLSSAEYVISGGNLSTTGAMLLNVNSELRVSGSTASVQLQEMVVSSDTAKLSIDLDEAGCSMITVGADAEDDILTAGAQLDNLTIEISTLDSYQGGDHFNLIWAANNGISGVETVTLVNNSSQDFELVVVDATDYGFASGELLQLRVIFDPASADFNADNKVDMADFAMFAQAWLWEKE